MTDISNLERLEAEAIHILREGVADAENPVLLFSGGKDSTVLAHLAVRAFYPAPPPLPLLHVDSTWEFQDVIAFRDAFAARHGVKLLTHHNQAGAADGLNPIDHGDVYTSVMRTEALKEALDRYGFDVIFGGARRDEEASRAKERIVSVRDRLHSWDPRRQRPELWSLYNLGRSDGQTLRVYPISNWTEQDLWSYIALNQLDLCPLYFAARRPIAIRDQQLIVVDDVDRARTIGLTIVGAERVRFRSLGCWPVTAAMRSSAETLSQIVLETLSATYSERSGRVSDSGSLEAQKRVGYF